MSDPSVDWERLRLLATGRPIADVEHDFREMLTRPAYRAATSTRSN